MFKSFLAKKILSFILCIAMVMGIIPAVSVSLSAEGDTSTVGKITGVSLVVDGIEYSSGQTVTLSSSTTSILLKISCTDFEAIDPDLSRVNYSPMFSSTVSNITFTYDPESGIATNDITAFLNEYESCVEPFELSYSNDGGETWSPSGIHVLYGLDYSGNIVIEMSDYYGDGWEGASIIIYENGEEIATATLDEGNFDIFVIDYNDEAEYSFAWRPGGAYDFECSYTIYVNGVEYEGEVGVLEQTHVFENGRYVRTADGHYLQCDICEYYDEDSLEAHYEAAEYTDHCCDVCNYYVREWCTPIDVETDHRCVNGENCGKWLSDLCVDDDANHYCDGCEAHLYWECEEDLNDDHVCDVCDVFMSDMCKDTDNDHICDADNCAAVLSYCSDDDDDYFCDRCGMELRVAWDDVNNDGIVDQEETVYSTLDKAFDDSGVTIIKLMDDIDGFVYGLSWRSAILDLNGHVITLVGWFDIFGNASLTIRDSSQDGSGRIVCDIDRSDYVDVYAGGSVTLEGGTVEAIRLSDYAVTLNGGTVDTMIVANGLFVLGEDAEVAEWDIWGGTFNFNPSRYLGEWCAASDNGDGTWTVIGTELGDVNGDTIVNSDDAVAILRYLAGYDSSEHNIVNGDYNGDGTTNSDDAVAILRMLAGYED